jgi:glycosyltransferase involved in cell wall biosynthesis
MIGVNLLKLGLKNMAWRKHVKTHYTIIKNTVKLTVLLSRCLPEKLNMKLVHSRPAESEVVFDSYDLRTIGPKSDWILALIDSVLCNCANLSDPRGHKVNFYFHYSHLIKQPPALQGNITNVVLYTHEESEGHKPSSLFKLSLVSSDLIICMNQKTQESLSKFFRNYAFLKAPLIAVNHFAGVSEKFINNLNRIESAKAQPKQRTTFNVGFHCRPYPRKRPWLIAAAINLIPNAVLYCCGTGHDRVQEYNELKAANKLQVMDLCYDDLHLFYSQIDVLVCCSSYEGGPTPLIEAHAYAIPYVSSDVGFASELATEYDYILPVNSSPEEYAEAISKAYLNSGSKPNLVCPWESVAIKLSAQISAAVKNKCIV